MSDKKSISSATNLIDEILDDCRVMLRYAKTESKTLDEKANQLIASIEKLLLVRGETLGSTGKRAAKPPSAQPPEQSESPPDKPSELLESLLSLHGILATVVAPTTPVSLRATESERSFFGSLGNPPLMLYMMSLSLVFLLGYLFSLPLVSANSNASSAESSTGTNTVTTTNGNARTPVKP